MKKPMNNKLKLASIVLITIGVICLLLEGTFYGHVDESGIMHESFFLPLGMLTLLLGIFIAFFLIFKRLLTLLFAKQFNT